MTKGKLVRGALVAAAAVAWLGLAPEAKAATHGCVSSSGVFNVTSGKGGPVTTGSKCEFTMVKGDTYSGVGAFTISCPGAAKIDHAATAAPAAQTKLECADKSTVTIEIKPGATVAAGNPS